MPADLATIYNFNATFKAGITGLNQTVVVIEDTDVYKPADWTTFRTTFGLSGYTRAHSRRSILRAASAAPTRV